ncbi:hypothetical protein PVK06_026282 [Gossypium arboreum]|uniref:RNase H type-1 domain-containing protein n=2 Tax=Gossypium TaxID=3633 RepID=A0ABR0NX99_GOSAR|nr:hypothetical protein PVK06_026282 [Gossypium arboreum]
MGCKGKRRALERSHQEFTILAGECQDQHCKKCSTIMERFSNEKDMKTAIDKSDNHVIDGRMNCPSFQGEVLEGKSDLYRIQRNELTFRGKTFDAFQLKERILFCVAWWYKAEFPSPFGLFGVWWGRGILRDEKGNTRLVVSKVVGVCAPLLAEVVAVKEALNIFFTSKWFIRHIPRAFNIEADLLARIGINRSNELVIVF